VDVNWEAIAAIAEGLGAIGVIATVIYVGLQIRHNSHAVQGATEQALMSQEMALYALLAEHPSIYRRGSENMDDLDADEIIVFEQIINALMSQLYCAFAQFRRGLIPESVWTAYLADWPDYIKEKGFNQAWSKIKKSHPREFLECLESVTPSTR
jgi:hypothetical protein